MMPIFSIQHWGAGVAVHELWVKPPPSQFVTAIMRLLDANVIDSYYLPGWQTRKISGVCWRCTRRRISCLFFYFLSFSSKHDGTLSLLYNGSCPGSSKRAHWDLSVPQSMENRKHGRITGRNNSKIKFTSQFFDVSISQE